MKPKTEEFLYFLLWACETLSRPTWRNLSASFEQWAYHRGFLRQLQDLEAKRFIQQIKTADSDRRLYRLTEMGRQHVLGGRDPEACWGWSWDGWWRLVLFDVPLGQETIRDRLRRFLRSQGFGCLQKSVWISPHPLRGDWQRISGEARQVKSLLTLKARSGSGETDEELVANGWDFKRINESYTHHLQILANRPKGCLSDARAAGRMRCWAAQERAAWLEVMAVDPLLPRALWPTGYLGERAWRARKKDLARAGRQIQSFRP